MDKTKAKAYPGGSYLLVPADLGHTMGADVDTIIIGTALGPWKTRHDGEMHHRRRMQKPGSRDVFARHTR